jgi:nitroimidazol reductase NimA-like FMN-containing flavoprotein (pyridoxamine 5'-phosphate oxidase superfamily)
MDVMTERATLAEPTGTLSDAECRRLLGTRTLGRVGVTSGGLPCILPVCYLYDDGFVVFRTGTGTKLRAAENGDVLAFEVDDYDPRSGRGWSVLALGRASVITTEHEHDGLPTLDGPRDHGERNHYVRLRCELVTGRVIETAPAI